MNGRNEQPKLRSFRLSLQVHLIDVFMSLMEMPTLFLNHDGVVHKDSSGPGVFSEAIQFCVKIFCIYTNLNFVDPLECRVSSSRYVLFSQDAW